MYSQIEFKVLHSVSLTAKHSEAVVICKIMGMTFKMPYFLFGILLQHSHDSISKEKKYFCNTKRSCKIWKSVELLYLLFFIELKR